MREMGLSHRGAGDPDATLGGSGGIDDTVERLFPYALAPTPAIRERIKVAARPNTAAAPATSCFGLEPDKAGQMSWRKELKDISRRKHAEARDTKPPLEFKKGRKVGNVRPKRPKHANGGTGTLPTLAGGDKGRSLKVFHSSKVEKVTKKHLLLNKSV